MLKRYYSLIAVIFLLAGCTHNNGKTLAAPLNSPVSFSQQHRKVSEFNQVDVQGRVNISVHSGYKDSQVILTGDPRDLIQVKTAVKEHTLYLILGNGFPRYGVVNADIRGKALNRLHYVGAGTISGKRLYTKSLDLSLDNPGTTKLEGTIGLRRLDVNGGGLIQINGVSSQYLVVHFKKEPKVQLTGVANLRKLYLDGGGWLSLYWVKSENLLVRAKKSARIQLAGAVQVLNVELWGTANFKGRFLRAQRSFVKTHDKSVAEISSVNHQSTLSTDASDIYYYNLPVTRADFMAYNGSTLDMREWDQLFIRDFTRYNKQFP